MQLSFISVSHTWLGHKYSTDALPAAGLAVMSHIAALMLNRWSLAAYSAEHPEAQLSRLTARLFCQLPSSAATCLQSCWDSGTCRHPFLRGSRDSRLLSIACKDQPQRHNKITTYDRLDSWWDTTRIPGQQQMVEGAASCCFLLTEQTVLDHLGTNSTCLQLLKHLHHKAAHSARFTAKQ